MEACWSKRGKPKHIPTPGYTKRKNFFITLFWPGKRIAWDAFNRRRNIEFRKHLSHLVAYAKRHKLKKIILFIDHATYHETPQVKKFLKNHPTLKTKFLGKKDPNSNPVECHVNKRLNSAVCVNKFYKNIQDAASEAKKFLRKYAKIYAT